MDRTFYSLNEKLDALKNGDFKCTENVKYFLERIKRFNQKYNIFLEISEKEALKRAEFLEKKRENRESLGKLFGLVIAVKPNISVKGLKINCSSKTLENYSGTFNADVIKKILEEDGIIIGTVNCDEFACGSSGETSAFGKCLNPTCPNRIPGGSSSGSAASISLDLADLSLGSDTGGSIRNPASHCGVVGVKPSYGRVSRYGLIDLSMSLDQIGPFSKDVFGSALLLSVIAGSSEKDPTTENIEVEDYTEILKKENENKLKELKFGYIKEFEYLISDDRIKKLYFEKINKLKERGFKVEELSLNCIDLGIQAYYPIVYTEFYSGTRKFDGIKYGYKIEETCGKEVLRRILGGKEISKAEYGGSYYKKALKVKKIISEEFEKAFKKVDVIIAPTTPKLPHKFGTRLTPEEMYSYDAFTIPVNLAGICGGVVSKDKIQDEEDNVPVGFQIISDKFCEKKMFKGMKILENL